MIVPQNRLLIWVTLGVLPFALVGALAPSAAAISWLVVAVLAAIVTADAIAGRRTLAALGIQLPAVSRMAIDRKSGLELKFRNALGREAMLRVGLAIPTEVESCQEEVRVSLPGSSEWSHLSWACIPRKRGNHRIEAAYIESKSPMGFWATRKTVPTESEIRVYPNLAGERRSLAALFLHRGAFGLHAQRQLGKGREFEKLRDYQPGDGYDEIHWKATARRGRPITKVFQIERTQEVYVILDASRLSARRVEAQRGRPSQEAAGSKPDAGTTESGLMPGSSESRLELTSLERLITAALVLGLAAEQQGDLFGLLTFSNRIERFLRARNGKAHFSACQDALYTLQPRAVTADFDEVCTFIRMRLRRRALLVFLTALDDPVLAESFVRNMELLRGQHLLLVNMLQPPGVRPLFSNPDVNRVDDLYNELGGHLLWHNLNELQKVLQRRGVRFSLLKNERLSAELVSQYLSVKQRQLL